MSNPKLKVYTGSASERTNEPIDYSRSRIASGDYGEIAREAAKTRRKKQSELHKAMESLPPLLIREEGRETTIHPSEAHRGFLDYAVETQTITHGWFRKRTEVTGTQLTLTRKLGGRESRVTIDPKLLTIAIETNGDLKITLTKTAEELNDSEKQEIKETYGRLIDAFQGLGFCFKSEQANTEADLGSKAS